MLEMWRNRIILRGDQRSGGEILVGINIQASWIFEQLAQAAQQAAFALVVECLVKDFLKIRSSESDPERPLCVASKISSQSMKPAKVRNQHGFAERAQSLGSLQKINRVDAVVGREMT